MEVVYVIHDDNEYREVSKEEYDSFDGEKFFAPSHWRLMFIAEMLLPYRYI